MASRLEDAEATAQQALVLAPEFDWALEVLGEVHLRRGDIEASQEAYTRMIEAKGWGEAGRLWVESLIAHTAGRAEASAKAAVEFERNYGADDPSSAAQIRAWRGETDAAFAWLDKALAVRDPNMALLKTDSFLTPLHADPRWNALLKKTGLPTD